MLCDCELGVIQQYNIYSKTATFFEKSGGNTYLGLAVALATWYNRVSSRMYSFEAKRRKNDNNITVLEGVAYGKRGISF